MKDRQHNDQKKDRRYNDQKKDRRYNDQKKDRRYNDQKKEDRQHNEQKKEDKQWSTKHTYKPKDLTTQTPKDNKINSCRRSVFYIMFFLSPYYTTRIENR
jgi:hypothetical protein